MPFEKQHGKPEVKELRCMPTDYDENIPQRYVKEGSTPLKALLRRIGWTSFKMMFFGTGVIYLSIGFLFWFWFGDHSTGYIWRQVILRGWSSTAASLLVEPIRIVIGAQQVIGTSMLAAIALEGGAVTILKAPAVSILRYTNTGPMDLWPSFYFGWKARKGWSINLALGMIIPMVVSFWASQFMSPMILVDIHPEVIVGEEVVTLVSEGLANLEAGMVNYANRKDILWQSMPAQYALMGGVFGPPDETKSGVLTTGSSKFGLIPVETELERKAVQQYKGDAIILDATVTCSAPTMTQFKITGNGKGELDRFDTITVEGKLSTGNTTLSDIKQVPDEGGLDVSCYAALPSVNEKREHKPVTLCMLNTVKVPDQGKHWRYMVIQTVGSRDDWFKRTEKEGSSDKYKFEQSLLAGNPWTKVSTDADDQYLLITLCTSPFSIETASVTVKTADKYLKDPLLYVNETQKEAGFKSVASTFRSHRNLWNMTDIVPQQSTSADLIALSSGASQEYAENMKATWVFCTYCFDSPVEGQHSVMKWTHPSHTELAQQILFPRNSTSKVPNPAQMLQGHFVTLAQSVYYDHLSTNKVKPAKITNWMNAEMPTHYWGLLGLLATTLVHVVTSFIVMMIYLARADGSRLESAWLSVSQFSGYTPDGGSDGLEIWSRRARAGWTDEEIEGDELAMKEGTDLVEIVREGNIGVIKRKGWGKRQLEVSRVW